MSCAVAVFDQVSNWLARSDPRPLTVGAELDGSSYVNGQDKIIRAVYTVRITAARTEETMVEVLRHQFGRGMMDLVVPPEFMFETPRDVLLDVFRRRGGFNRVVPAALAVAAGVIQTRFHLMQFDHFDGPFAECGSNYKVLSTVISSTLVYHTTLNPQGLGRPQLSSATVRDVCTNKGAWSELEDGDVGATITPAEASTKLGELIASLDRGPTTPEHNSARSLLRRVVTVVVRRSCTVPTATPVSEDEDEDEDDELDEEGDGEEHEYEGPEEEPGSSGDEHESSSGIDSGGGAI